jgi:hypothetical protein
MPKKRSYDMFISYSLKDRPWVSKFVAALRSAGVRSWFDVADIKPHETWQKVIQDALRSSSTLIVILSHNSVQSPWILFELGAAVAGGKRIIPILTEDIDLRRIPLPLTSFEILKIASPKKAGMRVAEVLKRE